MINISAYSLQIYKIWETPVNLQTTVSIHNLCINALYFQIHRIRYKLQPRLMLLFHLYPKHHRSALVFSGKRTEKREEILPVRCDVCVIFIKRP